MTLGTGYLAAPCDGRGAAPTRAAQGTPSGVNAPSFGPSRSVVRPV
jgi:hypothetical protein